MIKLGCTAEDKVTGFRGVVTGRVEYLTGCNQVLLTPKVDKDGKSVDGAWFDEQRVTVDRETSVIELDNSAGKGPDKAPPIR